MFKGKNALRPIFVIVTAVLCGLLASCSTTASSSTMTTVDKATPTQFAQPGPYAAGTYHYDVNGDAVVVWYPTARATVAGHAPYTYHLRAWLPANIQKLIPPSFADGVREDAYFDVPVAPGSFPVVLFSHGFGGYPEQSSFLTAHLATWGMIVVAPDQQKRDLSAVIAGSSSQVEPEEDISEQLHALAYIEKLDRSKGSLFFRHVDSAMVASLGHSAGGGTAVLLASAYPALRGWIALAGVPVRLPPRGMPSLMISGSLDKTVPTATVRKFYNSVSGRKALLVINGYGHNVFDDICTINHAHGGVVQGAKELHLPVPPAILQLATDGCSPPDEYPPAAWPLIDQAVTSQLRYDFGETSAPFTSSRAVDSAFPGQHVELSYAA